MVTLKLVHDYDSAARRLGNRQSLKLGYETVLHRHPDGYAVRHFATDIVVYRRDGSVRLDTGGWYSRTTFDRIRQLAASVYSDHGQPWVFENGQRVQPYYDGMEIVPR